MKKLGEFETSAKYKMKKLKKRKPLVIKKVNWNRVSKKRMRQQKRKHFFNPFNSWWNRFWYNYHHNGMSFGGYDTSIFKEGRLALVLVIIGLIIILIKLFM